MDLKVNRELLTYSSRNKYSPNQIYISIQIMVFVYLGIVQWSTAGAGTGSGEGQDGVKRGAGGASLGVEQGA